MMTFWKRAKHDAIVNRLVEEKIYEQVLREIEAGLRRDGLWAKAIQRSRGNEQEAKALYIEYRAQSIKDEAAIAEAISNQQTTVTESIAVEKQQKQATPRANSLDRYDADGYTPLMRAVKAMDADSVIELLNKGANPKIKDHNFGTSTALTMAKLLQKRAKTAEEQQAYRRIIDALEPVS